MAWAKLITADGDGTADFDTGVFTTTKFLLALGFVVRSSDSSNTLIRIGNSTLDTGSNYSWRKSADGGTDTTGTSATSIVSRTAGGSNNTEFYVSYVINISSEEKLSIINLVNRGSAGASNAPNRAELVAKWVNTSNQADIFGFNSGGANTLSSDSNLSVLGTD